MIIAVDGPAASGKGTLAKGLARHYGLPHLDTGLLYRAVGRAVRDASRAHPDFEARAIAAAQMLDYDDLDPESCQGRGWAAGQQGGGDRRGPARRFTSSSASSRPGRTGRCSTGATSAP